jgi:hypothetical protein
MTKSEIRVRKIQGDLLVAFGRPADPVGDPVNGINGTPGCGRRPVHLRATTVQWGSGTAHRIGGILQEKISLLVRTLRRAHEAPRGAR